MKTTIKTLALLSAVTVVVLWASSAAAFHDGGVARCAGCHTMHNSENNTTIISGGTPGQGVNAYLLKTAKPTDTCLICHARPGSETGYGVFGTGVLSPKPQRGAGDYVFLLEDNINDGHRGATTPIMGYQAGHNIISDTKGILADPVNTSAPGGTYPAASMACSSCHDPHGTDAFRLLYGANRLVRGNDGVTYTFTYEAPEAVGVALSGAGESQTNHSAYLSGMSAWCGNCHGDFHANDSNMIHPSGSPLGTIAGNYNAYMGTTDCVENPGTAGGPCGTGSQASAYLPEVPFEDPSMGTSSAEGPSAASRVMCLTCHRAHATSAPNAGRWDFALTLIAEDGHESGSYALPNPYDDNQRSLCNKCHSKDEFDHLPVAAAP
ncbi:MAG TPA: cytochrome c3 family protein [Thermoanaerobaculia bacterium]|nr:cytochrome c3 family protein [Thermoanaerobaculia bacterium]